MPMKASLVAKKYNNGWIVNAAAISLMDLGPLS